MRSGDGLVISYLIRSGVSFESSDLGDEGFCPYPGFFGTVVGNDVLSGEALESFFVEKGVGFELQPRRASSPTSGAMAARRGVPPFAGDKDNREILVWTNM